MGSFIGGTATAATSKTPFDKNLVKNPGAEDGAGTSGYSSVTIPHWKLDDGFTVVRYGAPGFPPRSESTRIAGGRKFFSCGQNASHAVAFQDIHLHGRQALVDNGHVKVILRGRFASYASRQDSAFAVLDLSNDNFELTTLATAHVAASDGVFISKSKSAILPPGTNRLQVQLIGDRADNGGTYCDAYFDNISVVLKLV